MYVSQETLLEVDRLVKTLRDIYLKHTDVDAKRVFIAKYELLGSLAYTVLKLRRRSELDTISLTKELYKEWLLIEFGTPPFDMIEEMATAMFKDKRSLAALTYDARNDEL